METEETAVALTAFTTWWRRIAERGGYSTAALSTLDTLDRAGPHRISDLAARERMSQPGMTGLITRLGDDGLVERLQDPDDGRVIRAAITDAGRARLAVLRERRREQLSAELERLGPPDREALAAAVPALVRLMELPPAAPDHPTGVATATTRTSTGVSA